jgi:hypothetical protein
MTGAQQQGLLSRAHRIRDASSRIFLLRFTRNARRTFAALALIFLAHAIGYWFALRGGESANIAVALIGLAIFTGFRGLVSTLPYAADRLIGPWLDVRLRALVFPLALTAVDWAMSLLPAVNTTESSRRTADALAGVTGVGLSRFPGAAFMKVSSLASALAAAYFL